MASTCGKIWRRRKSDILEVGMPEDRWCGRNGEGLADEVFARLIAGKALDDLRLGEHKGRIDLRGIKAPIPTRLRRFEFEGRFFEQLGELLEFRSVSLEGLDFAGAFLDSLRFYQVRINNCRFDQALCQGWRMWASDVTETTFQDADLRSFVTGSWYEGRGTVFSRVFFCNANMTSLNSTTATYIDCDFSNAKLTKVDFQSSSFIRCKFAGRLKRVTFRDRGFKTGKPDPNPMEDIDFSEALFDEVIFHHLSLDRVRLPKAEGHIILMNYPCVLEKAIEALKNDPHPEASNLKVYLEAYARHVIPEQRVGIFADKDFEMYRDQQYIINVLRHAEQDCNG